MNSNKKFKTILGALGIVYGDIGTSPLYVLKECFNPEYGLKITQFNVLGIISLILWSLTFVIVIKYLTFIMKADNNGEGGPIALISLITKDKSKISYIVLVGLLGTALLFGDAMITPAISVISAIEGLHLISPKFSGLVIPITVGILVCLFGIQKRGTERVGKIFGPVTLLWFIVIAAIAIPSIINQPVVLKALNPYYAIMFFIKNGISSFLVLGAVVLCVTGGEALYADMGHIGRGPIKHAWYLVVYPALVINYLGQGGILLSVGKKAAINPFFNLVDGWLIYPLVIIATVATIIASQALITGTFSIVQQAIQLGYLPRMAVLYTTRENMGQTYIPIVNNILMIGCVTLVITMKSSSNLAGAYGIAVIMTMTITSILFYNLIKYQWKWSRKVTTLILVSFLSFDLIFLSANLVKIWHGGWISLSIGFIVYWLMLTWKKGNRWLYLQIERDSIPIENFISRVDNVQRIDGTGFFMTVNRGFIPFVLINNLKHNKILHRRTIILSIQTDPRPEVPVVDKIQLVDYGNGIFKVVASFGFMEIPQVKEIIHLLNKFHHLGINFSEASFYLGREVIKIDGKSNLNRFSKKLYSLMKTNAQSAPAYFRIPKNRTIEIGGNVSI